MQQQSFNQTQNETFFQTSTSSAFLDPFTSLPLPEFFSHYLNYQNPLVYLSAFHIFFNVFYWNITSHIQYKTKFFSSLFNSKKKAVLIHSIIIFSMGLSRNFLFKYVVDNAPSLYFDNEFLQILFKAIGYIILFIGVTLVSSATYKLGVIGTFNGDAYGYLLPGVIKSFPFNFVGAPMYLGSTLNFIAFSVLKQSIIGIALSFMVALVYMLGTHFEDKLTTEIYKNADPKEKRVHENILHFL